MDMKLEVVVLPVSDVDRAKRGRARLAAPRDQDAASRPRREVDASTSHGRRSPCIDAPVELVAESEAKNRFNQTSQKRIFRITTPESFNAG